MAYDIHTGQSAKSHTYRFSISERDFENFLDEIRHTTMSLNKLSRFVDYYTDVEFKPNELAGLVQELSLLAKHSVTLKLIEIAKVSLEDNVSILGFAD